MCEMNIANIAKKMHPDALRYTFDHTRNFGSSREQAAMTT